jgi:hypothetical protein
MIENNNKTGGFQKLNILDVVKKWLKLIICSLIILVLISIIKTISCFDYIILFINILGTLLVASALTPMHSSYRNGLLKNIEYYFLEQPAGGEPITPNLPMLWIGIALLILGHIFPILFK